MKHSLGPWRFERYFAGGRLGTIYAPGNVAIAKDVSEDNGPLIASAPDLLEERDVLRAQLARVTKALRAAERWMGDSTDTGTHHVTCPQYSPDDVEPKGARCVCHVGVARQLRAVLAKEGA